MDTWTLQSGFPIVTVTRNYKNGSVTLMQVCRYPRVYNTLALFSFSILIVLSIQERFLLRNGTVTTTSVTEPLWWIPITYTTERQLDFNTTKPSQWIKAVKSMTLSNLNLSPTEWVLFNIQETGK